jgi:hypothetical protein
MKAAAKTILMWVHGHGMTRAFTQKIYDRLNLRSA